MSDVDARSASDRGLLLGEGVFETLLVLGGVAPHLGRHIERAVRSAGALGLAAAGIDADWAGPIRQAWLACGSPARASGRLTFSMPGPSGLGPPADPAARAIAGLSVRPLPATPDRAPWRAAIVSAHRVDPAARISGHKTLSWLPWILARREARERGAEVALVATIDGDVCEADHANLFAVLGGEVVTPPLTRGVLPGITRERVLRTLRDAGRPVREDVLRREDLWVASEIFLSSSLGGVRSVGTIDGRALPGATPVADWLGVCVPVS